MEVLFVDDGTNFVLVEFCRKNLKLISLKKLYEKNTIQLSKHLAYEEHIKFCKCNKYI